MKCPCVIGEKIPHRMGKKKTLETDKKTRRAFAGHPDFLLLKKFKNVPGLK
jgi:hypothetical protein